MRLGAFTTPAFRVAYATRYGYKRFVAYAAKYLLIACEGTGEEGLPEERKERLARVVRTTKTVRGRRYRSYYVKIDLPERIAERVEAYRVLVDEETGRIVLEPLYRGKRREQNGDGG